MGTIILLAISFHKPLALAPHFRNNILINYYQILMKDMKVRLSTLWIFLMFNYLYCDVLSNMEADVLNELLSGEVAGMTMNDQFLLSAAILMEIPIMMIVVARLTKHKINRWANIIAGLFMALVQVGSLFVGSGPNLHYAFYSAIEITTALAIAWFAWNWKESK